MKNLIIKLDKIVFSTLSNVAIVFLVGLFILMAINVLLRFFPIFSLGWFDEIIELLFSWMIFCEAAVLWRLREHPYIDLLESKIKRASIRYRVAFCIECINITFLSIFVYYSYLLTSNSVAWSPIFKIPKKLYYLSMPVAGVCMICCSVVFILSCKSSIKERAKEERIEKIESKFDIRG